MKAFSILVSLLIFVGSFLHGQTMFQISYEANTQFYCITQYDENHFLVGGNGNTNQIDESPGLLLKIGQDGSVVWAREYQDSVRHRILSIAKNTDGNILMGGQKWNPQQVGGVHNVFLIHTDSSGNVNWNRYIEQWHFSDHVGVTITSDSCILFAESGISAQSTRPGLAMIKYDSNGDSLWSKWYKSVLSPIFGFAWANQVIVGKSGDYFVAGGTWVGSPMSNGLIAQFNSQGDTLWTFTNTFSLGVNYLGIIQLDDSSLIACSPTGAYPGPYNMILSKLSAMGDTIWSKRYITLGFGFAPESMVQMGDGNIAVTGTYRETIDQTRAAIVKLDEDGEILWASIYGDSNVHGNDMIATDDGGLMVVGWVSGPDSLDRGWILKTDSLGNSGCSDSSLTMGKLYAPAPHQRGGFMRRGIEIFSYSNDLGAKPFAFSSICTNTPIFQFPEFHASETQVYPNPFSDQFTILPGTEFLNSQGLQFILFDLKGRQVFQQKIPISDKFQVRPLGLSPGMYFYKLTNWDGGLASGKLLKE
ncbi:MAG: T9SS type A sorting domain-containing protein [Bacteroidia bacterium]|nr:T9SS type A sorting domain-containing protein [Bacteroidia bacterium]